ncbi:MAG: hypothetical protein KIS62_12055 [Ramlibacter sp.]|nr:hypothetical protein [Ramlibacter sp.]MBX3659167.1 hypothetical protein [Ramlibacter sp.]MCW5650471.1 hypothetical protein [Ramlibacter sp.]
MFPILKTGIAACLLGMVALAPAQSGPPPGGPPPEAIAACQGKAAQAACTFTGRQGESLSGTCFQPPPRREAASNSASGTSKSQSMPMACRPANAPPGPPQGQGGKGPPPQ